MKFKLNTKYAKGDATIREDRYVHNNSVCLTIVDSKTSEVLCIATTVVAGYQPEPGHVLIKNWSENEGVYESLLAARVIGPVIREVPTGFVTAYECEYLG